MRIALSWASFPGAEVTEHFLSRNRMSPGCRSTSLARKSITEKHHFWKNIKSLLHDMTSNGATTKTVETVLTLSRATNTPLKQGVNETLLVPAPSVFVVHWSSAFGHLP